MKQVFHDKIVNIPGGDVFDRKFLFEIFSFCHSEPRTRERIP